MLGLGTPSSAGHAGRIEGLIGRITYAADGDVGPRVRPSDLVRDRRSNDLANQRPGHRCGDAAVTQ